MKIRFITGVATAGIVVATGHACSTCIAHAFSAALQGIGAQTATRGTTLIGISYLNFKKSNNAEEAGVRENEDFNQTSLDVVHAFTERLTVRGSIPQVNKRIRTTDGEDNHANGLGDISVGTQYQIPTPAASNWLTAVSFDVKLPTGANSRRDADGNLLEQHLQLGSGSTDGVVGLAATTHGGRPSDLFFLATKVRVNGSNSRGFRYGNAFFYGVGYSYSLGGESAAVLELNGRISAKDRQEDGTLDGESGGHLGYLSLSYRRSVTRTAGIVATFQLPVIKALNGSQNEERLLSLSVVQGF